MQFHRNSDPPALDRGFRGAARSRDGLIATPKQSCMISRAITVPQTLEPAVETGKVPVEGWTSHETEAKLGV